jgi:hypothetical protein
MARLSSGMDDSPNPLVKPVTRRAISGDTRGHSSHRRRSKHSPIGAQFQCEAQK